MFVNNYFQNVSQVACNSTHIMLFYLTPMLIVSRFPLIEPYILKFCKHFASTKNEKPHFTGLPKHFSSFPLGVFIGVLKYF